MRQILWEKPKLTVVCKAMSQESVLRQCKTGGGALGIGVKQSGCHWDMKGGKDEVFCTTMNCSGDDNS